MKALLVFLLSAPLFAGGLTVGLSTGINPNVMDFNSSVTKSQIQLGNYVESDNLQNAGNSSIGSTSSSIVGIPLGFNVRYVERFFIIRAAFLYHIALGGTNSITTTVNSVTREVSESYDMRMFEIPLTFAFNIRNDEFTRFYAGAGPSLFWGSAKVTYDNGDPTRLADEDIYTGATLGAHLLIGGEVSVSRELSISMEVVFNYGNKAPVTDDAVTPLNSSSGEPQDAETTTAPDILGIYNIQDDNKFVSYDPEHPNGLDFNGFQLIFSVNYFAAIL